MIKLPKNKTIISLGIILAVFLLPKISWAATYYVDYGNGSDSNNGTSESASWQRAPGMAGFAGSYSHSEGDIFVFKGGVTWSGVWPFTIGYSGGSGNPDKYIGGQLCGQTGFPSCNGGVAWGTGYPVFDGGNFGDNSGMMRAANVANPPKDNVAVSGFKWINCGNPTYYTGACLVMNGGSNKEISYNWFEGNSVNAFGDSCNSTTGSHTLFHHNTILMASRIHINCSTRTYDDYQMYNNDMQGLTASMAGYHTDGFMVQSDAVGGFKFTNIKIYNNRFHGEWTHGGTAWFYTSSNRDTYGLQHLYIYNNEFTQENITGGIMRAIWLGYATHLDDVRIYNNTIDTRSSATASSLIGIYTWGTSPSLTNFSIKNNIFAGATYGIIVSPGDWVRNSDWSIDYNIYYGPTWIISGSGSGLSCNTMTGGSYPCRPTVENHGQIADPKFVALPHDGVIGSGDWRLQPSSPAIDHGVNLSSAFTTDYLGVTRPQGSAWDIGAYEYVEAAPPDTTPPAPPSGVTVN